MKGFVVALVGPDGAGKSSLAERLVAGLGRPAARIYAGDNPESAGGMLPTTRMLWWYRDRRGDGPVHGPPPVTRPAPRPALRRALGAPRSVLMLSIQCSEEWARLRRARRLAARGTVVVLDRSYVHDYYWHDVSAQSRTVIQRAHGWWLQRVLPLPDLTVVLDAPAELLYARKPEGSAFAVDRRRSEYLSMPQLTRGWVTIDAGRMLAEVERDTVDAVLAFAAAVERTQTGTM